MSRKACWGQFRQERITCRECEEAHACMRARAGERPGRMVTPGAAAHTQTLVELSAAADRL
jgi:hypothetical protein